MIITSIILIGVILSLVSYIPKDWVDKHIYKEIDPNDDNF
jgi:hypothetical protein